MISLANLAGVTGLVLGAAVILWIAIREPRVGGVLIAGFLLRAGLVLVHVWVAPLPGSDADALGFLRQAIEWSSGGVRGALSHFVTGSKIYSWLLSMVFALTVPSELLALAINVVLGTLVIWNVWRLSLVLTGDEEAASRAAWLVALFPTLVLYSAFTLREAAVIYPFSLGLLTFSRWWRDKTPWRFYASLALFAVSAAFHSGMIVAVLGASVVLVTRLTVAMGRDEATTALRTMAAGISVFVVLGGIAGTGIGLEKFAGAMQEESAGYIAGHQESAARSRTAYLQGAAPTSIGSIIAQIPLRITYFLFAPFPWLVRGASDVIGFVDSLFYLASTWAILRSFRAMWGVTNTRGLMLILGLLIVVFSISTSNYGTALRHRAKMAPLFFALYAAAESRRKRPAAFAAHNGKLTPRSLNA